jgi:hypothetical protein
VAYARVPDSLKQSLRAPQSAVSASPRRLSSWSSAVSRRSQPRRRLLSSNANSRPRRASWPNAWTAQRRRARAAGPCASGSSSRPTPTERSPSGPGRTLSPARAAASPCTAPTCCSAADAPNCDKARTSPLLSTRTADLVQNDYLALLGALGVLVGLALATTDQNAARSARSGARSRATQCKHDLHATRKRTRSQSQKPADRPENASTKRNAVPGPADPVALPPKRDLTSVPT